MHITIANKVYSSWSMRPWLVLKAFEIPFGETLIPFGEGFRSRVREVSPTGKVPVLVDGETTIWESLSIIEYLADRFPAKAIWPADPAARAHARSVSSEMHAGFHALRGACPMNLAKRFAACNRGPEVAADVERLDEIWTEARTRFGASTDGPFLYGRFSAADAMFAPMVARLDGYGIEPGNYISRDYMAAIINHPAYVSWRHAALGEPWVVPEDEANETATEDFRAPIT